nr:hypothetical protein CFP56_09370 [Quercus suber]
MVAVVRMGGWGTPAVADVLCVPGSTVLSVGLASANVRCEPAVSIAAIFAHPVLVYMTYSAWLPCLLELPLASPPVFRASCATSNGCS